MRPASSVEQYDIWHSIAPLHSAAIIVGQGEAALMPEQAIEGKIVPILAADRKVRALKALWREA